MSHPATAPPAYASAISLPSAFGEALLHHITTARLAPRDVAATLGISLTSLHRLLCGEVTLSAVQARQIAHALHLTMAIRTHAASVVVFLRPVEVTPASRELIG